MTPRVPVFLSRARRSDDDSDEAICEAIMEAWRNAGHPEVKAWVDPHLDRVQHCGTIIYTRRIKTNLVGGLPPKAQS